MRLVVPCLIRKILKSLFLISSHRYFASLTLLLLLISTIISSSESLATEKNEATGHGGQGVLEGYNCFKTSSKSISEVCAHYTVNWKLWSLVGEPVGDYNLKWQLNSITLSGPQQVTYYGNDIPSELAGASKKIELYIDASASVLLEEDGWRRALGVSNMAYHRFNTGVPTQAGKVSYNTPGSPKWSEMFTRFSIGEQNLTEQEAKEIFNASHLPDRPLRLTLLELRPKSAVSELSALEGKIDQLCSNAKTAARYRFCPEIKEKKPEKKKAKADDPVDDPFAALDKSKGKTTPPTADPFAALDHGGTGSGFDSIEAYRAEQERLRIAAEEERKRRQSVRILSPADGDRVTSRVIEVRGETKGLPGNVPLTVRFNNATQMVKTSSAGEFSTKIVLKSGDNAIEVCFEDRCNIINLQADIERLALMATLTWEGRGDLDLHVASPSGRECWYKNKQLKNVCNLDIDDTKGVNPENISVPLSAEKGTYRFWVINFNGVGGVRAVLKLYQNEELVKTEEFVASGSQGATDLNVNLDNFR